MTEFAVDITRHIAAPRARVYRALLDPALLTRWMHPPGDCVGGDVVVEERPGGRHRVEYLTGEGVRHVFDSTIVELVEDERVVLDFAFEGPEGGDQREGDTVLTFALADAPGGGTDLRLVHERVTLGDQLNQQNVNAGWNGAIDRLVALTDQGGLA